MQWVLQLVRRLLPSSAQIKRQIAFDCHRSEAPAAAISKATGLHPCARCSRTDPSDQGPLLGTPKRVNLAAAVTERARGAGTSGTKRPLLPSWVTYGVEMELCYPCDMAMVQRCIAKDEGVQGWSTKVDVSVKCRTPCKAVELNSPVLTGVQGLISVHEACRLAHKLQSRTCKSGAVHVHVGILGGSSWDLQHLKQIAINFIAFEPLIDRLIPPSRRSDQNLYAKSLDKLFPSFNAACQAISKAQSIDELIVTVNPGLDPEKEGRRYKLNFRALKKYNTVEWRLFGGSANASKITGCVLLAAWFVHCSKTVVMSTPEAYSPERRQTTQGVCQALMSFLEPECCEELLEWIPVRAADLELQDQCST